MYQPKTQTCAEQTGINISLPGPIDRITDKPASSAADHLNSRGFTLIEIMIAIVILGMVLSTVYVAYSGTMKIVQEMEYESNIYKMARTTLDRLIRDLTSIQQVGGVYKLQAETGTIGNHAFGSVIFPSAAHLAFDENEMDGSMAQIGYFVEEDEGGGNFSLRRSDLLNLSSTKEKSKSGGYVICRNINSLNFKFYDSNGKDYDSWDSASNTNAQKGKVPLAVQIEISLVNTYNMEKPFLFMTKVFLPGRQ
jgi:general secretion pathway protein J